MSKDDLVVVAGAGGFIGGDLVRVLQQRSHTKIRAVDMKPLNEWYQQTPGVENQVERPGRTLGCRDVPATHPARTSPREDRRQPAGSKDSERRLTPDGERHALEVGEYLTHGITVDTVLCSSTARARQTLELLKLGDQLDPDRVEIADRLYNAGTDTLINAVRELSEHCQVALLVGHAPGAPGLVHELADPATSRPEAVSAIESRFPAAGLAQLEFEGDWAGLETASLESVWMPSSVNR